MTALFIPLIFTVAVFYLLIKEKRWIMHGRIVGSKHLTINHHRYYIEEVKFGSYKEALHKFYKIVADVAAYDEALEVEYDLYDWTYSIFRFTDTTIELRHLMNFNRVRLIKSSTPISIEKYEMIIPI